MTHKNGARPPRTLRAISKDLDELYNPSSQTQLDEVARKATCALAKIQQQPPPSEAELAAVTWASFNADFEAVLEQIYGPAGDQ